MVGAILSALLWAKANWKAVVIGLAMLALTVTGYKLYQAGEEAATQKYQIETLQHDLAVAEHNAQVEKQARQQDAILANEAAKRQAALSTKIDGLNQYVDTLETANSKCLDGADVERLRYLWQ